MLLLTEGDVQRSFNNPPTGSIGRMSNIEAVSMGSIGESCRPKTVSDNYELTELPSKKPTLTPRDSTLPPRPLDLPRKKMQVRKTKSSNLQPNISRATSGVRESS
jgi:hypothetical protein